MTLRTSVPLRSLTVTVSAPPSALKSTLSTPSVSIVMLAGVAEEPQPVAVRRQVDVLGDVGAVEAHRVGAGLALDRVAAVARIPDERVVTRAQQREVVAAVAVDRCRCRRRRATSRRPAAGDRVVARSAVERAARSPGAASAERVIASLPARPLTASWSVGLLVPDRYLRPRPETVTPEASPPTLIASLPLVPLTTTRSAAPSPVAAAEAAGEVDVDAADVGAAQVVDGDRVGAAERVEVDPLDAGVSIVMLPTSRKNRSRLPFADRSTCSATAAPLKRIVSVPSWPSTSSLPSPGSQTKVSSPAPSSAMSLPRCRRSMSLPSPPSSVSAPAPPASVSLPAPPSIVVGMRVGEDAVALVDAHGVVAGAGVDAIFATACG